MIRTRFDRRAVRCARFLTAVLCCAALAREVQGQALVSRRQTRTGQVTLRIRPPVGDTLRMQMEQQFEMTTVDARGAAAGGSGGAGGGGGGGGGATMSGSMQVWTHAIPLRRVGNATDLISVTDSVKVSPPGAAALKPLRDARKALQGKVVNIRMASDGEISVLDGDRPGAVLQAGVGVDVPSVLPSGTVKVGDSWSRDIAVPLSVTDRETALVHTTLRLDSLSDGGGTAYLSIRGEVSHDHAQHSTVMHGTVAGTLVGSIELDRRLGWITGSRTVLDVTSLVQQEGREPTRVRVRVTQTLRALVGE